MTDEMLADAFVSRRTIQSTVSVGWSRRCVYVSPVCQFSVGFRVFEPGECTMLMLVNADVPRTHSVAGSNPAASAAGQHDNQSPLHPDSPGKGQSSLRQVQSFYVLLCSTFTLNFCSVVLRSAAFLRVQCRHGVMVGRGASEG